MGKAIYHLIFIVIIMGGVAFANSPEIHFWKTEYERKFDWCKINMPQMNLSDDKHISFCYGDGWKDYCQISYPEYCPNNNYSDYDRCLRSCVTYGHLKECPCRK